MNEADFQQFLKVCQAMKLLSTKGYEGEVTQWRLSPLKLRLRRLRITVRPAAAFEEREERMAAALEAQAQAINSEFKPVRKVKVPEDVKP